MVSNFLTALLFILFLYSSSVQAQQQVLIGKVVNESANPIPFVSVKWMKDTTSVVKFFCIADENGSYKLNIVNESAGWIEVSAIGYNTAKIFVEITNLNSNYLDIILTRRIRELAPIVIINKPGIEISGDTTSYFADKFKRGNEANVGELLSNIPGFLIGHGGSISYNGKMIDRVLINGDDLTGRNYSGLISNLDINGIDKLQVIQNHADNSNILSGLTGGKEQVLNIRYKKGFLNKVFGATDATIGLPVKHYDAGLQALALFDKSKIILLNKANSIGNTNFEFGLDEIMSEDMNVDAAYDIQLLQRNSIAGINDIFINTEAAESFYKNQTSTSTVSLLLKPLNKLSVRGRFNYMYDKYAQRMDNLTEYFIGPQATEISENKNILKRLRTINDLLSFNYMMSSKSQLLLTLKAGNQVEKSDASSLVAGTNTYSENIKGNENQYAVKMIYNRLLRGNAAITADIQYLAGQLPNEYNVLPALFTDFFGFNTSLHRMSQVEIQYFRHSSARITFVKRKNRHAYTLGLTAKKLKEELRNNIAFFSTQNAVLNVGVDSVNDNKNILSNSSLTFQDTWTISKKMTITFFSEIIVFENRMKILSRIEEEQKINGVRFLPGLSTEYKFSEKSRLSFLYNRSNRFSDAPQVANGFLIQSLTSLYKGMDSLQTGFSQTARLTYAYTNLLEKRLFIFSNILFIRTPLLYLMQIQPFLNFTYSRNIATERMINTFVVSLSGQKLSDDYKTQFSPSVNLSQSHNYRLSQGSEEKIRFRQLQAALSFNTEIEKVLLKTRLQYSVNEQKVTKKFINHYWEVSVGCNWKLTDGIFLDMQAQYNYLNAANQQAADLWCIDSKLLFKSRNNKWDFGMEGKNMLNQSNYTTAIITPTNASITSYSLFPRVVAGFVKYRF